MAKAKIQKPVLTDLPNNVYNDRNDLTNAVGSLGNLRSERDRYVGDAQTKITKIQDELQEKIAPLDAKISHVTAGIVHFVKNRKDELFPDPEYKTLKLTTGSLQIRKVPASVKTRTSIAFLEKILEKAGLFNAFTNLSEKLSKNFLRIKLELNKEAILADPINAKSKTGIEFNEESERLYIRPDSIDVEIDSEVAA
ncbi:host-nuclease inhibitor Gam family protein [Leptospira bandrabouensis]|uniref:host-nuclease inhibitor Gam family protein n=1 Tax=Leptospira bandrabouensis TaxID=2484903 RepID=UPI00223DC9AA|nr:host-nuclease inhibitor Gam family protein [Leptospira bandrabouensis]MCW7459582.1 host-nuclease inhibitor Gam family protein [Leptospira bandrabouensis]MCW7478400.1 host-nuclease inhibitor Gam family protein [Leptospira bandrabouensis]MCW7486317.1 host-nuclease inhibitor Gam family protein [Leptospira bandrabouensis]